MLVECSGDIFLLIFFVFALLPICLCEWFLFRLKSGCLLFVYWVRFWVELGCDICSCCCSLISLKNCGGEVNDNLMSLLREYKDGVWGNWNAVEC